MSKYAGRVITDQAAAGYSVYFDGTGDYLTVADNAALDFGTGDFTIEAWVYPTANNTFSGVLSKSTDAGTDGLTLNIDNGTLVLKLGTTSYTGSTVSLNTWSHVAATRNGTSVRVFLNGTQVASGTDSYNTDTNGNFRIGAARNPANADNLLTGYISNARAVKGTAVYTAAFTPPTQLLNVTNTSLLTCNSPAIVDQSSNAFAITTNGNAAVSTFTPFAAYNPYNPALGASTPGVWTLDEAMQAAATRQWNMYDPYFQNTTLLLHGNGTNTAQNNTFLDSSSNNFTITRNGNTTQGSFSPFSQTGWSNYFDGTGDFLTAVGANLALGTGNFTIEFWFYAAAYSSAVDTSAMFDSRSGNDTSGFLIGPVFNNTNTLNVVQNTSPILTANTTYPLNTWVHCAVVRSSGTITLYQNGISVGSVANTTNNTATTNYIASGYWQPSGSGQMFNGYLSNLRISNTARYTANFTPSASVFVSDSNTRLLACQSNRFLDSSSNAYPITPYGTPSVQAFSPFYPTAAYTPQTIGGSGYFDGGGDYLTVGSSSAFNLPGDFTMEAWCYFTSRNASYTSVIQYNTTVYFGTQGTQATFYANTPTAIYLLGGTIQDNAWNHIAVARSGSTVRLWLNGASVASDTNSGTIGGATPSLWINSGNNGTSFQSAGYYNGIRIVKGTAVYDPTQTSITVPTAPLTNITNTSLLLNFTNAGIVDSTAKNVLETVGNAQISTTQSKFGGGSMAFDGTGDWLLAPNSANLAFNTGDFTIECWVYPTASPSYACIIDTRNGFGTGGFGLFITSGTGLQIFTSIGVIIFTGTSCITTNTWQHVVVCRSGTSLSVFVNGTQIGSTITNSANMSDGYLIIGNALAADRNYPLTGYIDDLRITKGIARYTGNFTPQTSQWQDQ